jgi:2-polyprenyl-6-methoxyphenol hydroxylase-like FAD-dependent oxidoreductase
MKAVVCGAGIAGLASAYFLARKGWDVLVVERAAGLRTAGYMIDFTASGYDAAEAGGLLPALQAHQRPVEAAVYVDENDRVRSLIDYQQFAASQHGRLLTLLRGDLERVLHDAVPDTVECRYATSIAGVDTLQELVDVTLTDGTQITADLLVGADGIHSHVRELVFGPEAQFLRFLGYHTAAFLFQDEAIAAGVNGQFRMLSVPKRQVAAYAIGDGHLAAFFAHTATAPTRPADPVSELRRVYGDLGWHVPRMLAAAGAVEQATDLYYDVVAQVELPRWRRNRVVLVGDAGYAVSLLAGQGASLAVAGAHLLAEAVAAGNIDEGLDRFEAVLRPAVRDKQAAGRRTADFFVPPTAFHNWLRDAFLNAVRLPVLSRLLGGVFAPSLKSVVKER